MHYIPTFSFFWCMGLFIQNSWVPDQSGKKECEKEIALFSTWQRRHRCSLLTCICQLSNNKYSANISFSMNFCPYHNFRKAMMNVFFYCCWLLTVNYFEISSSPFSKAKRSRILNINWVKWRNENSKKMNHKENGILMKIMKNYSFNFVRQSFSAERSSFIAGTSMAFELWI